MATQPRAVDRRPLHARDSAHTARRAGERSLTLRGIEAAHRITIRPGSTIRFDRATPSDTLATLVDALTERAKKFRKRLRASTTSPRAGDGLDDRVHDLRTAARRLLSVLDALESFIGTTAVKPLAKSAEKALDRVGRLRDLGVQRQTLATLRGRGSATLLKTFDRDLRRQRNRSARRLAKRLASVQRRKLRRTAKRLKKRVRRCRVDTDEARDLALSAAKDAYARLCDARAAMDPNDPATLHAMRIALKRFRYLMEVLRPVFPRIEETAIESLHKLQSALGDLHDLDVLTESIAEFVEERAPTRAKELTAALERIERRHCTILLSSLRAVDPILEPWKRILTA